MKDKKTEKSKSPYHLKRGDRISIVLNGSEKKLVAISKSDYRNGVEKQHEPLFIGSNLFKFLEKNCSELFYKEMKDKKGNKVRITKLVRV